MNCSFSNLSLFSKFTTLVIGFCLCISTVFALNDTTVNDFRFALRNNNVREFKRLVSQDGLLLVRSYNSNNFHRGQDLLLRVTDIPENFQISVPGGLPFDLKYLFGGSLRAKELNRQETHLSGINFDENSVPAIRLFCQKVLSAINSKFRGYAPTIIADKEFMVLTEADMNHEMLSGSIALFVRTGNAYCLKAVIDLR